MTALASLAIVCLLAFPSCNHWLYEDEGDCSVYYRINFRYDMNLKWSDAFANEVSSVHLYAFNTDGLLVWDREEIIDTSNAANYSMLLDLPAGDYRLLAWCGLSNDGSRPESFSVPEATIGVTRIEDLQCSLNRLHDTDGSAYSDSHLYRLFHGTLDVTLPEDEDGGTYEYTLPLTKNTNHIRVMLHHLSGEDVDVNDFIFHIEDENGLMGHDNMLREDEMISYRPWDLQNSEAGLDKEDPASRAIVSAKGAIADLTVGRMMEDRRKQMILVIDDKEGHNVGRIPVIFYALLGKEYYEEEYGHKMTDQEFLDREDDYVMTFFLDEKNKWVSAEIYIHSWHVIYNEVELE